MDHSTADELGVQCGLGVFVDFQNLVESCKLEDFHEIFVNGTQTQFAFGGLDCFVDCHEGAKHCRGDVLDILKADEDFGMTGFLDDAKHLFFDAFDDDLIEDVGFHKFDDVCFTDMLNHQ